MGPHTIGHKKSGRSFTHSKMSSSQRRTPWFAAATTQLPANTMEPPSTATTSTRRMRWRLDCVTIRVKLPVRLADQSSANGGYTSFNSRKYVCTRCVNRMTLITKSRNPSGHWPVKSTAKNAIT